jgi:hypothetical protein
MAAAMERSDVDRWMERYVRAWETNDPGDIGALFTDDARYYIRLLLTDPTSEDFARGGPGPSFRSWLLAAAVAQRDLGE